MQENKCLKCKNYDNNFKCSKYKIRHNNPFMSNVLINNRNCLEKVN